MRVKTVSVEKPLLPNLSKWMKVEYLPWAIWLFAIVVFMYREEGVYNGLLAPDPDNYLRASQILDFIKHWDWFNTNNARLDPPGVDIYSRIVDIPYALVAAPLAHFFDARNAVLISAFIVPAFILLPAYLWLSVWMSTPFVGKKWAYYAVLPALWGGIGTSNAKMLMPGEIDHHGWQTILFCAAIGCVARFWNKNSQNQIRYAFLFSLACAVSVAIGMEALPFWAAIIGAMGLHACLTDDLSAKPLLTTALGFPALAMLMMALLLSPENYFRPYIMSFSFVRIELALGLGFALFVVAVSSHFRINKLLRLLSGFVATILAAAVVIKFTPDLLSKSAWLGMDDIVMRVTKANANELNSGLKWFQNTDLGGIFNVFCYFMPLMACLGYFIVITKRKEVCAPNLIWLILTVFSILGNLFIAVRIGKISLPFAIPGLLLLAKHLFYYFYSRYAGRVSYLGEIFVFFFILGPLGGSPLTSIFSNDKIGDALFNFTYSINENSCNMVNVASYLNIAHGPSDPQRILAVGFMGPELIFRTPHISIGGGFYQRSYGFMAVSNFLKAPDDKSAAKILDDNKIDYVVLCNRYGADLPSIASMTDDKAVSKIKNNDKIVISNDIVETKEDHFKNETPHYVVDILYGEKQSSNPEYKIERANTPLLKKADAFSANATLYEVDKNVLKNLLAK